MGYMVLVMAVVMPYSYLRGGTCVVGLTLVANGPSCWQRAGMLLGGHILQLYAVDHSARVSMKSAANCVN